MTDAVKLLDAEIKENLIVMIFAVVLWLIGVALMIYFLVR
jgi:hypothetical protein